MPLLVMLLNMVVLIILDLEHDINQDGDTNDADEIDIRYKNFCIARATIEADTYVAP